MKKVNKWVVLTEQAHVTDIFTHTVVTFIYIGLGEI